MKVLLVEDDPNLAVSMRRMLAQDKHVVDVADSFCLARAALADGAYDVVLLDRLLPDGDGLELMRQTRRRGSSTRFLVVSALGEPVQRVEGLDLGADDYIAKPFEPSELLARIRAAGRRPAPEAGRVVAFGNLRFEPHSRNFTVGDKALVFPRRELAIMEKLMVRPGRVVTRDALEAAAYGYDEIVRSNTLESHVSRLRRHLSEGGADVSIHTVRGVGYLLRETRAKP